MENHAERVRQAVRSGTKPQLQILDTCRLDNGGILPAGIVRKGDGSGARDFVAFVPAAGAASRYSMPLAKLLQAFEHEAKDELDEAFADLIKEGAEQWPLPESIAQLIKSKARL